MQIRHERGDRALAWIDHRLFGNTLAERLRKQKTRRRVALIGVLQSVLFGFALGYAAWAFIAPNPVSTIEKLLAAFFWIAVFSTIFIPPLVQKAVEAVGASPQQARDERQEQLYLDARSRALGLVQGLMLVAMLTGIGVVIAIIAGYLPWSHPEYAGIPFYIGVCAALFLTGSLSPYLILAWQLPDEPDFDDEIHHDG